MIRALLGLFVFSVLFIGCGGSKAQDKSNPKATNYETKSLIDKRQNFSEQDNQSENFFRGDRFDEIRSLIYSAQNGTLNDLTYICIGDSTRAISDVTHAQDLFNSVKSSLSNYDVNSILLARGGHQIKQLLDGSAHPTLNDVISSIPDDGSKAIVDISLGYNDFPYEDFKNGIRPSDEEIIATIKSRLEKLIDEILKAKPKTHIFLTSPNPNYDWDRPTEDLKAVYHQVAKEKNLPFADFVTDLMNGYKIGEYNDWYIPGDKVHFSSYGLDQVANYILEKILP